MALNGQKRWAVFSSCKDKTAQCIQLCAVLADYSSVAGMSICVYGGTNGLQKNSYNRLQRSGQKHACGESYAEKFRPDMLNVLKSSGVPYKVFTDREQTQKWLGGLL